MMGVAFHVVSAYRAVHSKNAVCHILNACLVAVLNKIEERLYEMKKVAVRAERRFGYNCHYESAMH